MKIPVYPLVILLGVSSFASGAPDSRSDILEVKGETVRVRLLDAFSAEVISDSDVEVHSDNNVRCVRAPCPTNDKQWKGKADANGYIIIPTGILQQVTTITTPSHKDGKDLVRDSEKGADGAWVVELYSNHVSDSSELGMRPFKLIDARSNRPLADILVRIAFGETESFEGKTNSLGYIFLPFEKALPALENTWVTVPGYRRAKIDFGGVNYRTKLERQ
jgi:hypothetical protein